MTETIDPAQTSSTAAIWQLLRGLFHLAAVICLTAWGFLAWPMPWPGVLVGAGALVLSVLLWALFLSPRPVLRTDRFVQALFELLLLASAVYALLALGVLWVWPVLLGAIGAVVGYVASTRAS